MEDLEQLIAKSQEGDREAFGKIYTLFYKRIYRYCQINLQNQAVAQDLCQETFLKAWKSLGSFSLKNGGSLQAYLFKIARNLMIDLSRKKKEVSIEQIPDIEKSDDLEDEIDKKDGEIKVWKALSKLKELERQVIILRFFEDLSTSEVAKVVGIKEGALRVRLHRILKDLKEILGE